MGDCHQTDKIKYLRAKHIRVRDLCVKNATAQNITSKNITSENVTSQNITTQNLTTQNFTTQNLTTENVITQNLTTQNLTTENLTTQNVTTQNLTTQNLTTQALETGDLIAKGNVYFDLHEFVLEVGANKTYKSIQDAVNALQRKIIFGTIRIKVDPGTYDGFNLSGFEIFNNLPVYVEGDKRLIAGQTYVNNPDAKYYTFSFEIQGTQTRVQIVENFSNTPLNLLPLGLQTGDKVVFYNDDPNINPKSLRFSEATIVQVDSDSFNVDVILNNLNVNNTITFLPNVFLKPTVLTFNTELPLSTEIATSSPFPYLSNIVVQNNATITGFTCPEPDIGFTSAPAVLNFSASSTFINIVAKSLTWNTVTIDNVLYEGFKTSSGYLDNLFNQTTFNTFVVLGTGYNPDFYPYGPISINNAGNSIFSYVSIIGSVENLIANGTLFFYNSNCQLIHVNIIGTQALVGLLASKSVIYDSWDILITDSVEGIVAADNSFVEVNDSIVEKYDIAVISEYLSKMIFKNIELSDGIQDFCIQDLSQILRDGEVVVAPTCDVE